MARPLKDGLTYFQHDVNMSADEKIEALEAVHGNDGYAVFNKLLERIYKSFGKLDLSDDVQRLSIARKCNVSSEKFDQIIADAVRFHLFDADPWLVDKSLTSDRIRAQLGTVEEKREAWRRKPEPENSGYPNASEELSSEKTPVIQRDNPSYPARKVHKAEQSRGEQNREEQQPRAKVYDEMSQEERDASLLAFAFERARVAQGVKNPVAYAHTLAKKADVLTAWRESVDHPETPAPSYPEPPPCPACGDSLTTWPGDPPERRRCLHCGAQVEFNGFTEQWEPLEAPLAESG